jgi:diguanylate cyclase (GGDEF)-like protein
VKASNKIQNKLEKLNLAHGFSAVCPRISLSIGITCLIPNRYSKLTQLLERADKVLYQSKENGRNRIHIYEESSSH